MPAGRMHADEMPTDVSLVRRLLAAQFPNWADLPIEPVESAGTDNAIYRLGNDLAVRLPRVRGAVGQVEKEHRWLLRSFVCRRENVLVSFDECAHVTGSRPECGFARKVPSPSF
jgi:hypothetical protein